MVAIAHPRLALACVFVLLWQFVSGLARPGALVAPSADPGLCLALALGWAGVSNRLALAAWLSSLGTQMVLAGLSPLWSFLLGWPAWRALRGRVLSWSTLLFALFCIVVARCGGKLVLMGALPHVFPLTLTGATLFEALYAEAASTLFLLALFGLLFKGER